MNELKQWASEHRYASYVEAGLLLLLLVVTLTNFFSGLPEARQPAPSMFYNPNLSRWDSTGDDQEAAGAFSDRPLFSSTRRIKVPPPAVAAPPAPPPAPTVSTLEGWSLLGIFDSGEVKGALVRHQDGSAHRVTVGEQVDGWRLSSVGARAVRFDAVSGSSQAELNMTLATVAVLPVPNVVERDAPSSSESGSEDQDETPAQEEDSGLVTFKGYYGGPPSDSD